MIGRDESLSGDAGPAQLASKAVGRLTKVTREKAMALFGQNLRSGLKSHGEQGAQAWLAIAEMPEREQQAALASLVDGLEQEGVALYSTREDDGG